MAFDDATRGRLQRFVGAARVMLTEEFARQLQQDYGLDPSTGDVAALDSLGHLDDRRLETARILREVLAHYLTADGATGSADRRTVLDRIVREQAFTILNRLAALRMMEAREILIESVAKGYQSQGFQLYQRVANGALGESGEAYRCFLFSVFDTFATELTALFDRHAPQGRLFPREAALLAVLKEFDAPDLEPLWGEDETIGWIYQYFNSKEERQAMRKASQAPRDSRELAVRNQFFTPRYVVEFLVDNTLGRLWFNWTGGRTSLRDRCQYLLVKPDEQPELTARLRDPRTIKLLDPACGSMHFGLYAFDLFLEIYREAWGREAEHGPGSLDTSTQPKAGLKPLSETYPDEAAFLRDAPRLIIEHNIYGVEIDARAAQIASLALWLRAQRAWHDGGVKAADRPATGLGNVVAAVAPPAEVDLRKDLMAHMDEFDAELFEKTLLLLKGMPELGVLLEVERELPALIRQIYGQRGDLFRRDDEAQWRKAETRLRVALTAFAHGARSTYQGRLFTHDALEGLRLIDLTQERFEVVVMNPPFGEFPINQRERAKVVFSAGSHDILTSFVEVGLKHLANDGILGAITSRTSFFAPTTRVWRELMLSKYNFISWIDLGEGILDDAMVETCVYTIANSLPQSECLFCSAIGEELLPVCTSIKTNNIDQSVVFKTIAQSQILAISGSPFAYWLDNALLEASEHLKTLEDSGINVRVGLQTGDDFRFIRCWWEVPPRSGVWLPHAKGGDNHPYATDIHLVVNWDKGGEEIKAHPSARLNMYTRIDPLRGLPEGLTFPYRTHRFSPAAMPYNIITGVAGMGIYSDEVHVFALLAILNSSIVNELIEIRLGLREINALYQAGTIAPIPFPVLDENLGVELARIGSKASYICMERFIRNEESPLFALIDAPENNDPGQIANLENKKWRELRSELISLYRTADAKVGEAYGVKDESALGITERNIAHFIKSLPEDLTSAEQESERFVSYAVGIAFGRWKSSETLVDHEKPSDLYNRYLKSFDVYNDRYVNHSPNGQEVCCLDNQRLSEHVVDILAKFGRGGGMDIDVIIENLGFKTIAAYTANLGGFFSAHLLRYTRSRRRAPIYWPLSTASGGYTLWLYYPALTDQALYTAANDFVGPKLEETSSLAATLRSRTDRSRDEERQLEQLQDLEMELKELQAELLRLAPTWKPNHDDGVQITAAPLWRLFRHRPWQTVLKETWEKLEKGEYDWAHLARIYWPDRVREKCRTDKSLAVAHDLEDLYEPPPEKPGAGRRGRKREAK